jgi:hypothetical protein
MSDHFCEQDPACIDLADERYKICPMERNVDFLAASVRMQGFSEHISLRMMQEGRFIVVSGFDLVKAHIHNKADKIPVCILDNDLYDEFGYFAYAVASLAFRRPLTHYELITGLSGLSRFSDAETIAQLSQGIFNANLNKGFIKDMLLIASLPDPAMNLVLNEQLSVRAGVRLAGYDSEIISIILRIFSCIKASQGKQLEIMQNIKEICSRDKLRPEDFINQEACIKILEDKSLNMAARTTALRAWIAEQRFPCLSKARAEFDNNIKSLKFGSRISVKPPENFEGRTYKISFQAQNYQQFKDNVGLLGTALKTETLKRILNNEN